MKYSRIGFLIIVALGMVACRKKPDYPDTPTISYNAEKSEIYREMFSEVSQSYLDSLVFAIDFEDGDGDLGYKEEDRGDPANVNFFMDEYILENGVWGPSYLPLTTDQVVYRESFQLLSPEELTGPIDGTLFNVKLFFHADYGPNDTLKFTIKIKDRAGNFSNTIETPPIIINQQ